jgi:inorganic triphosphatase YgiF
VTNGAVEAELKYTAPDEQPLFELEGMSALGPAQLGPPRTTLELDRYLDTADLRLSAARWACRLRERDGGTIVSLKGPPQHRAGEVVHRRDELEAPAGPGLDPRSWPRSSARDRLLAFAGGGELVERFRLEQERTERSVGVGEMPVGVLSLDRVRVLHDDAEAGRMYVVELELDPAALAVGFDHRPLAEALGRLPGLSPDPHSKFERALALIPAP